MDLAERDKIFKLIASNTTAAAWSLASMEFLRLAITAGLIKLDDDNRPLEADHVSIMARTLADRFGSVKPGSYAGRLGLWGIKGRVDDEGRPLPGVLSFVIDAAPGDLARPVPIQPETAGAIQLFGWIKDRATAEEIMENLHDMTNAIFPDPEGPK